MLFKLQSFRARGRLRMGGFNYDNINWEDGPIYSYGHSDPSLFYDATRDLYHRVRYCYSSVNLLVQSIWKSS